MRVNCIYCCLDVIIIWFTKVDPDVNLKQLQIINLLKSIYKYSIRRHRSRNSRAERNSDIFFFFGSLLFILVST